MIFQIAIISFLLCLQTLQTNLIFQTASRRLKTSLERSLVFFLLENWFRLEYLGRSSLHLHYKQSWTLWKCLCGSGAGARLSSQTFGASASLLGPPHSRLSSGSRSQQEAGIHKIWKTFRARFYFSHIFKPGLYTQQGSDHPHKVLPHKKN